MKENWIYFIRSERTGWIKIGITTDVEARLQYHAAEFGALTLIGAIPGDTRLEAAIHLAFRHCRERREWFRPERELLVYIECRLLEPAAAGAVDPAAAFKAESDPHLTHLTRRRGLPWEPWEDQLLLDDQLTCRMIGAKLGRTPHSIGERRRWLRQHRETIRRMTL